MPEPNNPDLDSDALANRIRQEEQRGARRALPPFPASPIAVAPERQAAINVAGWKRRIRGIPLLGGVARWLYAFFGLVRFKMQVLAAHEQIIARQDALAGELYQDALARQDALAGELHQLRRDTEQLFARLRQELRLAQQQAAGSAPPAQHAGAVPARLDGFYAAFEDAFRGERASIKARQAVYLPYLSRFHAGTPSAPVLDIGCGRGEWLELLGENGLVASGVDLNALFVEQCRNHGFEAVHGDALARLAALPAGALGAVTGFHIAEHLAFDTLVGLLDAALRALRPGGVLILETPNPENLLVGALNFYDDPTHRNPLTPQALDFLARQRGFSATEILRLHPYPPAFHVADPSPLAERFNSLFYGPQDYALIAVK